MTTERDADVEPGWADIVRDVAAWRVEHPDLPWVPDTKHVAALRAQGDSASTPDAWTLWDRSAGRPLGNFKTLHALVAQAFREGQADPEGDATDMGGTAPGDFERWKRRDSATTEGAVLDVDVLARVFVPQFYFDIADRIESVPRDDISEEEVARMTAELVAERYRALLADVPEEGEGAGT